MNRSRADAFVAVSEAVLASETTRVLRRNPADAQSPDTAVMTRLID